MADEGLGASLAANLIDHVVPLIDLQAFERGPRHQAGVVDHHVDPTEALNCRLHQRLHLVAAGYVRGHRERLAAVLHDFVCERLQTVRTPRRE